MEPSCIDGPGHKLEVCRPPFFPPSAQARPTAQFRGGDENIEAPLVTGLGIVFSRSTKDDLKSGFGDVLDSLSRGARNFLTKLKRPPAAADNATGVAAEGGALEGSTDLQVFDPADPGRVITDIDRIENQTLWEEKSATWATDERAWIQKQVVDKFNRYLEARSYLPGYEDAPIGFDFTSPGVNPGFKAGIEKAISELRQANPEVTILVRWAQ
jgi:hypothetical protein